RPVVDGGGLIHGVRLRSDPGSALPIIIDRRPTRTARTGTAVTQVGRAARVRSESRHATPYFLNKSSRRFQPSSACSFGSWAGSPITRPSATRVRRPPPPAWAQREGFSWVAP